MTLVTVFRDKFARGWPRHEQGERGYVLALGAALERDYKSDAHFAAYRTPNGRRLVREAIDQGVAVELTAIVFDVDCPAVHGTGQTPPPRWRIALRDRLLAMADRYPKPYFYETRGGARIVYRQAKPTVLRTQADAIEWSKGYAVAVAHLENLFGIVADPACNDWQRLYRLPRATRDAGAGPENHPTWGDAQDIGTLLIEASPSDVAKAERAAAKTFREPRNLPSFTGGGDGLLFWALKLRGDVVGKAARGGWICRCPNRRQHSKNTDGSDSTVVFPAAGLHEIGAIHCKHGHCVNLLLRDWLALFSDSELNAAREAAGIKKVRAA
jgi:hypothetical protein